MQKFRTSVGRMRAKLKVCMSVYICMFDVPSVKISSPYDHYFGRKGGGVAAIGRLILLKLFIVTMLYCIFIILFCVFKVISYANLSVLQTICMKGRNISSFFFKFIIRDSDNTYVYFPREKKTRETVAEASTKTKINVTPLMTIVTMTMTTTKRT